MQLATVRRSEGTTVAVRTEGRWRALPASDLSAWYSAGAPLEPGNRLDEPSFGTPLPAPGEVVCCGLNYADHMRDRQRFLAESDVFETEIAGLGILRNQILTAATTIEGAPDGS